MRKAYALRLGVAASLVLSLAGCGPAGAEWAAQPSAVKIKPSKNCLAAEPIDLGAGVATIVGDSTDTSNRPDWCGEGPASYFTFTVTRPSALYVDTIGSSFDTVVGVLPDGCFTPPLSCADDACGSSQTQLVQLVAAGTYHLVVVGRTADDRGPFVVHAQLAPLDRAGMPAGEIPRGAFVLTGSLSSFQGGWFGDCGRGPFVWYWYASCPGEGGVFTASTANAGTVFDATLSFVDVDDGVEICCDAGASGPNVACMGDGLGEFPAQAAIEVVDEDEAGLHVLKVGAAGVMSVPQGEFQVIGYRP